MTHDIGLRHEIRSNYLEWLYDWMDPSDEYMSLFRYLDRRPFSWSISKDENRAEDGEGLRYRFECENHYVDIVHDEPCSVLEAIIGIADRISDIVIGIDEEDQAPYWFWDMMSNLGLDKYTDDVMLIRGSRNDVDEILDIFMLREYYPNGEGGLFPLENAKKNQREVEIWYQMSAYLDENFDINQMV